MKTLSLLLCFFFFGSPAFANPYWDKTKIPLDSSYPFNQKSSVLSTGKKFTKVDPRKFTVTALRITAQWNSENETYSLSSVVFENSGTASLQLRTLKPSPLGSYKATIRNLKDGSVRYDSIGTGQAYRKLARSMTFRFPVPTDDFEFVVSAENPVTGATETVLSEKIEISKIKTNVPDLKDLEIRKIQTATKSPALEVVIYADGFFAGRKNHFFEMADQVVNAFKNTPIPEFESMNFTAVFATSNTELGTANELGLPVQTRDSAFGLYYPYWNNFGRWYNVVYPTSEEKFRTAQSIVPYDYNIILMDSSEYWGVGNYKTHTAIPTEGGTFTYLLLHEFGHFMGLNEEYDGGGPTELEFAPQIPEAWSQNMTFLPSKDLKDLKWSKFVTDLLTPIPTPKSYWKTGKYGAYEGGYADSHHDHSESYKPGLKCIMDRAASFCTVCSEGIRDVINFDLGK